MRKTGSGSILMACIILLLVSIACGALAPQATPTPVATESPPATATATALPTKTPRPTATAVPTETAFPTPAPLGSPVMYGSLEITVLAAVSRPTMHLGDIQGRHYVYYFAKGDERIIDIAVLVHNLDPGHPSQVNWKQVFLVEANGDSWYPSWAKTKVSASNNIADPYSIGISSDEVKGDDTVDFKDYTYMRLVFLVAKDPTQTLIFGIADSPLIAFQVK